MSQPTDISGQLLSGSVSSTTVNAKFTVVRQVAQYIRAKEFTAACALCDDYLKTYGYKPIIVADRAWCLYQLGNTGTAYRLYTDMLKKHPENPHVFMRAAQCFFDLGRHEQVLAQCELFASHHPDSPLLLNYLGPSHYYLGEYRLAEKYFRQAIAHNSTANNLHSLGLCLLQQGNYQQGFALYEKRFESDPEFYQTHDIQFTLPQWRGESVQGKRLLIWCEQGLGDVIQFVRLIALIASQGATIDICLTSGYGTLLTLLKTVEGVSDVYHSTELSLLTDKLKGEPLTPYDFHCPLMSLLHYGEVTEKTIPARRQYMSAPTAHFQQWDVLRQITQPKVGIVWTTQLMRQADIRLHAKQTKSMALTQLEPLLALDHIQFVNLTFPLRKEDLPILEKHHVLNINHMIKDFSDTAAIIHHLDIVISIDTSVVHLAAAMGKPTLNLLAHVNDWRWPNQRDDCLWYPTMKLYKQTMPDDWDGVVTRVTDALKKMY